MKSLLALIVLLSISATAHAGTLVLNAPAGYPTLLGVSCGGVHTDSYATGFDSSGNPTAAVYAWTKCGGSGRGGGYHTTTYSSWHAVTWNLQGAVLSTNTLPSAPSGLDTNVQYEDDLGDTELTSEVWTVAGYVWVVVLEEP